MEDVPRIAKCSSGLVDSASSGPSTNPSISVLFPPALDAGEFARVTDHIKDYQITHGSLIKLIRTSTEYSILTRPIGASVFPTLFPRDCFNTANALQESYNELYARMSCDETWLSEVLAELIERDEFTATLWGIYQQAKRVQAFDGQVQMGIFRSDYMLHYFRDAEEMTPSPELRQVEFNTYSCAGGSHGNVVSNMHRHLAKRGIYSSLSGGSSFLNLENMPLNNTISSLAMGLAQAHAAYVSSRTNDRDVKGVCLLLVVQPNNVNICDERPLEYELWERTPPVPVFRVVFGEETLAETELFSDGTLLYQAEGSRDVWEVGVVYMRAGYDPAEYTEAGVATRGRLERSNAIKCPSLLTHLCGFKKIQQALTNHSALSRFLSPEKCNAISATFAPIHPLDLSPSGLEARKLALDPVTAQNHVLKPSLEGGGNNVYGTDIPGYLSAIPKEQWPVYILMKMIQPPEEIHNLLIGPSGVYDGPVKSELGVFGFCMWRRGEEGGCEVIENRNAGWSFKTKAAGIDEMSVIKGYGAFDSPLLVDSEDFTKLVRN